MAFFQSREASPILPMTAGHSTAPSGVASAGLVAAIGVIGVVATTLVAILQTASASPQMLVSSGLTAQEVTQRVPSAYSTRVPVRPAVASAYSNVPQRSAVYAAPMGAGPYEEATYVTSAPEGTPVWVSGIMMAVAAAVGFVFGRALRGDTHDGTQAMAMMGASSKKKKKPAEKKKAGARTVAKKPPVDVAALLRQSEVKFRDMSSKYGPGENDGEVPIMFSDYVVAARLKAGGQQLPVLSDWVPVASLITIAPKLVHENMRKEMVVASLCREISECVALSSPVLRNVSRSALEYAIEPMGSFETHVMEKNKYAKNDEYYHALGLEPGASAKEVKKAYRTLAASLHPDKFATNQEGLEEATAKLIKVKEAYTILGGGYGGSNESWYASLGGRARTDFAGPLDLSGEKMGSNQVGVELPLEFGGFRFAVAQLDPDICKDFLTRNAMRARLAAEKDDD